MSTLERSSVIETERLRNQVEQRVTALAGNFRKAAAAEMHSTTRRALHHNQALTSVLATLRSRLLHLREENHKLRDNLQEIEIKEKMQRETIERITSQSQKRLAIIRQLTEKAEEHARQHEIDVKQLNEAEQLGKNLRLQQAQLDATTELTSHLKEKATEKDIALELTATRLKEEDAMKRSLLNCIRSALQILQKALFQDSFEAENQDESVSREVLLKKLVELLTMQEESIANDQVLDTTDKVEVSPDPLLIYSAGDLGLLSKTSKKSK